MEDLTSFCYLFLPSLKAYNASIKNMPGDAEVEGSYPATDEQVTSVTAE